MLKKKPTTQKRRKSITSSTDLMTVLNVLYPSPALVEAKAMASSNAFDSQLLKTYTDIFSDKLRAAQDRAYKTDWEREFIEENTESAKRIIVSMLDAILAGNAAQAACLGACAAWAVDLPEVLTMKLAKARKADSSRLNRALGREKKEQLAHRRDIERVVRFKDVWLRRRRKKSERTKCAQRAAKELKKESPEFHRRTSYKSVERAAKKDGFWNECAIKGSTQ